MKVNQAMKKLSDDVKMVGVWETVNEKETSTEFCRNDRNEWRANVPEEIRATVTSRVMNMTVRRVENIGSIARIYAYERF